MPGIDCAGPSLRSVAMAGTDCAGPSSSGDLPSSHVDEVRELECDARLAAILQLQQIQQKEEVSLLKEAHPVTNADVDFRRGLEELIRDHVQKYVDGMFARIDQQQEQISSFSGDAVRRASTSIEASAADLHEGGEEEEEESAPLQRRNHRRSSSILSRWDERHAQSMITSMERQTREAELLALASLHAVSMLDSSFLREHQRPVTPTNAAGDEDLSSQREQGVRRRSSSLVQMWRELEVGSQLSRDHLRSSRSPGQHHASHRASRSEPISFRMPVPESGLSSTGNGQAIDIVEPPGTPERTAEPLEDLVGRSVGDGGDEEEGGRISQGFSEIFAGEEHARTLSQQRVARGQGRDEVGQDLPRWGSVLTPGRGQDETRQGGSAVAASSAWVGQTGPTRGSEEGRRVQETDVNREQGRSGRESVRRLVQRWAREIAVTAGASGGEGPSASARGYRGAQEEGQDVDTHDSRRDSMRVDMIRVEEVSPNEGPRERLPAEGDIHRDRRGSARNRVVEQESRRELQHGEGGGSGRSASPDSPRSSSGPAEEAAWEPEEDWLALVRERERVRQARAAAIVDALERAPQEIQLELRGLSEHRAVSAFAFRSRLQALLRRRSLSVAAESDEAALEERVPSVAAPELGLLREQRAVSSLREGFRMQLEEILRGQQGLVDGSRSTEPPRLRMPISAPHIPVPEPGVSEAAGPTAEAISIQDDTATSGAPSAVPSGQVSPGTAPSAVPPRQGGEAQGGVGGSIPRLMSLRGAREDGRGRAASERTHEVAQRGSLAPRGSARRIARGWLAATGGQAARMQEREEDNMEMQELLSRRAVTGILSSEFANRLSELILSYRSNHRAIPQAAAQGAGTQAVRDNMEGPRAGPPPAPPPPVPGWLTQPGVVGRRRFTLPPPGGPRPRPMDWDEVVGSAAGAASSSSSASGHRAAPSSSSSSMSELRDELLRIRSAMEDMRRTMETCMEMQMELQRAVRQEVAGALHLSQSSTGGAPAIPDGSRWTLVKAGTCCICCDQDISCLLYRCGHMCTCTPCAMELQQRGSHCPMCRAPIVEVVRAFTTA